MSPEIEAKITAVLDALLLDINDLETDGRKFGREILTHLSRINSTLSSIDRNLTLLEIEK